jgi:WD40 repeat protein
MTHPSAGLQLLVTPNSQEIVRLVPAHKDVGISSLSVFDLATGATREITKHGNRLNQCAVDASGSVLATADQDGVIRVGPLSGGEPHLMIGHEQAVFGVAISPDGRWLVSTGGDGTIRLWPMPDLDKPPLHTLPREELIAKLHSLTNLRVVRDAESSTGWKVEVGPFPGWAEVPNW